MEEAGDGALRREFELLKNKLADEGLFDAAHKKNIPDTVTRVGIITSASGAAIHDILTTLERRFPMHKTIVYPVPVQGKGASNKIAAAITKANKRKEIDVLIIARGGGSLEDLWEFNEEIVARAIYNSDIPVVTGIGHEVDFTIADFVADKRAATPTAAAELISPDRYQLLQQFSSFESRLIYLMQQNLQQKQQKIDWLNKRIRHPKDQLQIFKNKLNELQQRNVRSMNNTLKQSYSKTNLAPSQQVQQFQLRYENINTRFQRAAKQIMSAKTKRLQHLVFTLDALSPLHTLKRGYAIIKDKNNNIIRTTSDVKKDQVIKTELAKGYIFSTITEINND